MRRFRFKLAAAALTFTVGLAAYSSWARFFAHPAEHAPAPASPPVVEDWHRLYEAAGMSGDPRMRREVFDMLLCANRAGVADARPVAVEDGVLCRRRDGSEHEWNGLTGEYGPFFAEVTGGTPRGRRGIRGS